MAVGVLHTACDALGALLHTPRNGGRQTPLGMTGIGVCVAKGGIGLPLRTHFFFRPYNAKCDPPPLTMASAFVLRCAKELEAGAAVADVLQEMRAHYTTADAMRSKTCAVRQAYAGPARADADVPALLALTRTDDERARLDAWVARYGTPAWRRTGNEALDGAVRAARTLLPENVDKLRVTREEVLVCKQRKRERVRAKNAQALRVDGDALLQAARATLAAPERASLWELALALLLATGRRTAEVLNGRSAFSPGDDGEDGSCLFAGQLKARNERDAYRIPVLAPLGHVLASLARLRALQPADVATLTNAQVASKYQSRLRAFMNAHPVYGKLRRVHDLRGVYVWLTYLTRDWGDAWVAHVACEILGHSDIAETNVYTPFLVTFGGRAP